MLTSNTMQSIGCEAMLTVKTSLQYNSKELKR